MLINTSDFNARMLCKWGVNFLIPIAAYFLLIQDSSLSHPMVMFFVVTLWAVCAWAMNTLNDVAVGLLLPILYILFCGVTRKVVFAPWLSDVPIIVIGGFTLGNIVQRTGLGKRIGLACVKAAGGSYAGALIGITIAVAIVAPLVPAVTGKAALFCAIAISLCDALEFKPGSREASATLLAACLAVASTKLCYLTGGADITMGMGLVDKVMNAKTSWMQYAMHNFVPGMLYAFMSLALVLLLLPSKVDKARLRQTVNEKYQELGPMTPEQLRALILLITTLVLLATDTLHGMSAGTILILITGASFLPGISLMDAQRMTKVNFVPLFFIMGCMAIGSVSGALKVTDWIANMVVPVFNGLGATMASVFSYAVGVLCNFLLTPLAATSTLTAPLTEIGAGLGLAPQMLVYSFYYGLDNLLFPYEYAVVLYFFSFGYISFRNLVLVMGVRMLCTAALLAFVAVPYWRMVM